MSTRYRQNEIRRYLLGDPSQNEEQRSAIEREYLNKATAYDELLEMEDEIVDSYVFGRLSEHEAALFRASLENSSRWQKKAELATALRAYAAPQSTHVQPRVFFGVPLNYRLAGICAVCVLAVAAGVAVYSVRTSRANRSEPSTARTQQPTLPEAPPKQVPPVAVEPTRPAATKAAPTPFLSVVLIPDLVRGNAEQTQITLPRGRYFVHLRMERANEPYATYEASVSTPEGQNIYHNSSLQPSRVGGKTSVTLALSSEFLSPGVYILNLKGRPPDGQTDNLDDYTFQVSNR